jgi:hypothetical protein
MQAIVSGRDHDRFERRDGRWFTERRGYIDFVSGHLRQARQ